MKRWRIPLITLAGAYGMLQILSSWIRGRLNRKDQDRVNECFRWGEPRMVEHWERWEFSGWQLSHHGENLGAEHAKRWPQLAYKWHSLVGMVWGQALPSPHWIALGVFVGWAIWA